MCLESTNASSQFQSKSRSTFGLSGKQNPQFGISRNTNAPILHTIPCACSPGFAHPRLLKCAGNGLILKIGKSRFPPTSAKRATHGLFFQSSVRIPYGIGCFLCAKNPEQSTSPPKKHEHALLMRANGNPTSSGILSRQCTSHCMATKQKRFLPRATRTSAHYALTIEA